VYESILFEASDAIATITLNRPEKLNAYTVQMGEEVVDAFRRVRDDANLRAVILAGAGRAFCAGVDLDALRAPARRTSCASSRWSSSRIRSPSSPRSTAPPSESGSR